MPEDFFARLTKPFPIAVGVGVAAVGLIIGVPLLVLGGVALWIGAAALDALRSPASTKRPRAQLAWDEWERRAATYPPGVAEPVRGIIADGREVEVLGAQVDVADGQIRADLTELMRDVLWVGDQSTALGAHLDTFDAQAIARRAERTGPGTLRDALLEQVEVFDRLQGQYLELVRRLETLQAQLGAVKANMIQASLTQRSGRPVELGAEIVDLKETAHAISRSYAELGGDFDEFFEAELQRSSHGITPERVLDDGAPRADGASRPSGGDTT